MAAEMKVTDAAVEAATTAAWPEFRSGMEAVDFEWADEGRKDRLRIIARAALEAGIDAMLEPVGWLVSSDGLPAYQTGSQAVADAAREIGRQVEQLYRIKPE